MTLAGTPLEVADRLLDALNLAGLIPGDFGRETRMRAVLVRELAALNQAGSPAPQPGGEDAE